MPVEIQCSLAKNIYSDKVLVEVFLVLHIKELGMNTRVRLPLFILHLSFSLRSPRQFNISLAFSSHTGFAYCSTLMSILMLSYSCTHVAFSWRRCVVLKENPLVWACMPYLLNCSSLCAHYRYWMSFHSIKYFMKLMSVY